MKCECCRQLNSGRRCRYEGLMVVRTLSVSERSLYLMHLVSGASERSELCDRIWEL